MRRNVSYPEAECGEALKIRRHAEAAFFGGPGQFVQYACNFVKNFSLRKHIFNWFRLYLHIICQLYLSAGNYCPLWQPNSNT